VRMEDKDVYFTMPSVDDIPFYGISITRVGVTQTLPNYRMARWRTDPHTLMIILAGRGGLRTAAEVKDFSAGDVVGFYENDEIEWWTDPNDLLRHYWIGLKGEGARHLIMRLTGKEKPFVITRPAIPAAEIAALQGLLHLLKNRPPHFLWKAYGLLFDIIYSIATTAGLVPPFMPRGAENIPEHIKRFLDSNYVEPLSIEKIAKIFRMTPGHLTLVFQKEYGISPYAYLIALRLDRAKQLLSQGASVKEAAISVGYTDPNYFSRLFRKKMGIPPTAYHPK